MIDDLIFRGRSVEEALEKSSNFFGVQKDRIRYQVIEEGPDEVCIRLIENPMMPRQGKPYQETERTVVTDYPKRQNAPQERNKQFKQPQQENRRPPQRRDDRSRGRQESGGYQRRDQFGNRGPQRGARSDNYNNQRREQQNFRPPRDNWKPEKADLSALNEKEQKAFAFVENILKGMSFRVNLSFVQDQERLIFNIVGPDRGMLLTKKGEPLIAIQYLVNKVYLGANGDEQPIFIDSQGYRISRDEELADIAVMSAEKVIKTQREYVLNPMNPYERRIVHLAIKEIQGVYTESQGDGYIKKVAIYPGDR